MVKRQIVSWESQGKIAGINAARSRANQAITDWALGVANSFGAECAKQVDRIIICGRMAGFGVGDGLTVGDVIFTGGTLAGTLEDPKFLAHETVHAFQWARDGLMFLPNWLAMRSLSALLNPSSCAAVGGGGCMNLYEVEARAFAGSTYTTCGWDPEWQR